MLTRLAVTTECLPVAPACVNRGFFAGDELLPDIPSNSRFLGRGWSGARCPRVCAPLVGGGSVLDVSTRFPASQK